MSDHNRASVPPITPDRDAPPPRRPGSGGGLFESGAANAQLVYILYLLGFVLGGLSNIVGVVFAYVYKDDAEAWLKTHYHYQIRTFWLAILYSVISAVLMLVFVGFILAVLVAIWLILRCVNGLTRLQKHEPIDNVTAWLV